MAKRAEGKPLVAQLKMKGRLRRGIVLRLAGLVLTALLLGACTGQMAQMHREMAQHYWEKEPTPIALAPTHTPTAAGEASAPVADTATPEPEPTATATPSPTAPESATGSGADATATATRPAATATPVPTRARPTPTSTPKPTPIVVIPNGFTVQTDSVRGYSLALPRGYSLLDLRSAQFRNLANTLGMGGQMATLNEFLDSDAGQIVGILAASDLAGMIFGGLPTIAQVMVVDAKGASQDTAQVAVEQILSGQGGFLSNPVIGSMENATINNLPGVRATVTGNLAGANRPMAGKVAGLLANDKFYVLIQLTEVSKLAAKESIFDQIIGTFRPQ